MELAAINSPSAAFVAGLVTSLHCAGMCGPLACTLMPVGGDRSDASTVSTVYHACRLLGYAVLGAVAGGLGQAPLSWVSQSGARWLPWLLVLFFVALAFRWDRHLPKLGVLGKFVWKLQVWVRGRPRTQAAALMGLATPLLPCGPLYFLVALAMLSGSAARGITFMLAFGLGTVPLLWLAQTQFHWVRRHLSPSGRTGSVSLSLGTAAVVSWRLRGTLGFVGPTVTDFICL